MDEFMKEAFKEAKKGLEEGGVPIGAVLVRDDKIIGRGRNKRVQEGDPVAHAEIDCLRNAGRMRSYKGAILYSTLMPCYLCAGAAIEFKIGKVVVAESENFKGARNLMEKNGIEVVDLDLREVKEMMAEFIKNNQKLWLEDIGEL